MGSVSGRAWERCCARRCIDSIGQMIPEKKNAGMKSAEEIKIKKLKISRSRNQEMPKQKRGKNSVAVADGARHRGRNTIGLEVSNSLQNKKFKLQTPYLR